jgi:hypothetical protein
MFCVKREAFIVCNADPRVTLRLLGESADSAWNAKVCYSLTPPEVRPLTTNF